MVDSSPHGLSPSFPSVYYDVVSLLLISALSFTCPQIGCSSDGWSLFQILLTIPEAIVIQYPFWLLFLVCKGHLHSSQVFSMLWWLYFRFQLCSRLALGVNAPTMFTNVRDHTSVSNGSISFLIVNHDLQELCLCFASVSYDHVPLLYVWTLISTCAQTDCCSDGRCHLQLSVVIPLSIIC
jgi:hypothetical protein